MKIYEFYGMPGVGKSFLSKHIVPEKYFHPMDFYNQCPKAYRFVYKILLILRYLFIPSSNFTLIWRLMKSYSFRYTFRKWRVLFNWLFIDAVIRDAAKAKHEVIILDQGIAQGIWSTQFGLDRRVMELDFTKFINQFLQKLPVSKLVIIHVTAPVEIIKSRLNNRLGCSPLDDDFSRLSEAILADKATLTIIKNLTNTLSSIVIRIVNVLNEYNISMSMNRKILNL